MNPVAHHLVHEVGGNRAVRAHSEGVADLVQRDPLHLLRLEEPERALASGIQSIAALGGFPMFSPSLVPEEILLDHPERLRALVVEGANPLLSYSDTSRWREACDRLDLLVVIEPTMTETAAIADYILTLE